MDNATTLAQYSPARHPRRRHRARDDRLSVSRRSHQPPTGKTFPTRHRRCSPVLSLLSPGNTTIRCGSQNWHGRHPVYLQYMEQPIRVDAHDSLAGVTSQQTVRHQRYRYRSVCRLRPLGRQSSLPRISSRPRCVCYRSPLWRWHTPPTRQRSRNTNTSLTPLVEIAKLG